MTAASTSCSRSSAGSRSSAPSAPRTPSSRCPTSPAAPASPAPPPRPAPPRAAPRRFLLTLADLGYVRSDGRHFALTPRVLDLGYAYLSSLSLPETAEPPPERLVAEGRESSSVSVLDGDDIVYVGRVPTSRIMRVAINVGTRFPAHATSMGRVQLAGLPEPALDAYLRRAPIRPLTPKALATPEALRAELARIRAQGWALVDQELEEGLRSVAAPIRDREGRVVAAVNVSAHASRASKDAVRKQLLPPLLKTAARIEADLGAPIMGADGPVVRARA